MGMDSRDSYMLGWLKCLSLVYLKKLFLHQKVSTQWVFTTSWWVYGCISLNDAYLSFITIWLLLLNIYRTPKWQADIALTAVQGKAWGRAKLAFLGEMKAAGRNSRTICCWPFWENLSSWVCFLRLSVILFIELKFVYLRTMWFQAVCFQALQRSSVSLPCPASQRLSIWLLQLFSLWSIRTALVCEWLRLLAAAQHRRFVFWFPFRVNLSFLSPLRKEVGIRAGMS